MNIEIIEDFQRLLEVDVLFKPSPFLEGVNGTVDDVHSNSFCNKVKSNNSRLINCRKDCFSDLHEKFKIKLHTSEMKSCHAQGQLICIPIYFENEYMGTLLIGPFQHMSRRLSHKIKEIDIFLKELAVFDNQKCDSIKNVGQAIGEKVAINMIEAQYSHLKKELHPKVLACQQYLKLKLNKNITIEEVSNHIHMSESRLMHLFKEEVGQSVISYFNHLKLIEAEKYLIYTKFNINKICALLNFKSPSYFGVLFKNKSGETPLVFRKINKKLIDP
ncbi:MAG: hypothetical protein COA79_20605 [Planctomycetota bacterium]|nr:MAG: hypothetical protein COA79_20605 [Planctomycetota bacterium]